MSGPHNAGKGSNRRDYNAEAWNNSPLWDNIGPTKKNEHTDTGHTEEGILAAPQEGELSENTSHNGTAQ